MDQRIMISKFFFLLLAIITSGNACAQREQRSTLPSPKPVVINAGVAGNNVLDLLARLNSDCLEKHPRLTILMVGTNDMNSMKYVPLKRYQQTLELLTQKIKSAGSEVLLMTILPEYEPYLLARHPAAFYQPEGVEGRRRQINEVIRDIAAKENVQLLDLSYRFEVLGKIGLNNESMIQNENNAGKTDGVHPTPTGYRMIALAVYDYITCHHLPTNDIVCFGDSITKGDGSTDKENYPAWLLKLLISG